MEKKRKKILTGFFVILMICAFAVPAFSQVTVNNFSGTSWTITDQSGTSIIKFGNGSFTFFVNGEEILSGETQVTENTVQLMYVVSGIRILFGACRFDENIMNVWIASDDGNVYLGNEPFKFTKL